MEGGSPKILSIFGILLVGRVLELFWCVYQALCSASKAIAHAGPLKSGNISGVGGI